MVYLSVIIFFMSIVITPAIAQHNNSPACLAIPVDIGPGAVPAADQNRVCSAAEKAIAFFHAHDIKIQRPIRIRLHQDELRNDANHIGLYNISNGSIDIVTLDHAMNHCAEKPPFGVQMNATLYTSFIIHEVAHAIADQNINRMTATRIVQEYLAYVTQFATMDANARSNILQQYRVAPFERVEDMSLTYYQLNPNAFGVKAFLHYQTLDDSSGFIEDLLSGAIKPGKDQIE